MFSDGHATIQNFQQQAFDTIQPFNHRQMLDG